MMCMYVCMYDHSYELNGIGNAPPAWKKRRVNILIATKKKGMMYLLQLCQ